MGEEKAVTPEEKFNKFLEKRRIETAVQKIKGAISLRRRSNNGIVHMSVMWSDCRLCGGLVYNTDDEHKKAHQTLIELGVESPKFTDNE
ncbi:MAG: hypothetical protein WC802_00615 [Patescibacteria group bacterium]|jgi:hypothetical protein